MAGRAATKANTYCNTHEVLVNASFSDNLKFKISTAIKPAREAMPRTKQNGINLGYYAKIDEPSSETAMTIPNKFKRHSIPKLKNTAFAKVNSERRIAFFICNMCSSGPKIRQRKAVAKNRGSAWRCR